MHSSDKSMKSKNKMMPSNASIDYCSNFSTNKNNFNFDSNNFKPVIRNTNDSNVKSTSLENKSFNSSMSSSTSSTSSSTSAYQSDNNNNTNNANYVNAVIKPKSTSLQKFKHFNNHNNFNSTETQLNRIINELKNCSDSNKSESYTNSIASDDKQPYNRYNTSCNLNRLSSYDNHDVHDYLENSNMGSNLNIISESGVDSVKKSQHFNANNTLLPMNMINAGIYSKKRASIAGPASTMNSGRVKNKTSNSTTAINTDMYGCHSKSGNLFSRALGYATKKNSSANVSQKETWKSKLGKYLPHHLSSSGQINAQKCKFS